MGGCCCCHSVSRYDVRSEHNKVRVTPTSAKDAVQKFDSIHMLNNGLDNSTKPGSPEPAHPPTLERLDLSQAQSLSNGNTAVVTPSTLTPTTPLTPSSLEVMDNMVQARTFQKQSSNKRVSAMSQDSCETISSASDCSLRDMEHDNVEDGERHLGWGNVVTICVQEGEDLDSNKEEGEEEDEEEEEDQRCSELDFDSSINTGTWEGGDTLGDYPVPAIRRSTPREPNPYKSSRLGRAFSRSISDESQEFIHWKKGNRLGRGTFGTVFLGLTISGELIAVKQIELIETDQEEANKEYSKILQEVNLLKSLKHDNIVGYLGSSYENNVVSIFTEFIPGGSLATILEKFGPLELPVTARYTRQLLSAVAYMHDNEVVHRDIKSANIMLVPNGTVKLIDFGCAKRLALRLSRSGSHLQKSLRGTPYWMAPEVINETGHGRKSDIWSLGCTVFELLTGKPPWGDREPIAAIYAIGSDEFPVPQLPESFPAEAREFVFLCMIRDKWKRPPAKELVKHNFVAEPTQEMDK